MNVQKIKDVTGGWCSGLVSATEAMTVITAALAEQGEAEQVLRKALHDIHNWIRCPQYVLDIIREIPDHVWNGHAHPPAQPALEVLQRLCAEAYQVIGCLSDEAGRFDDPAVVKVLDNLSAEAVVHDDVLPFTSKQPASVPDEMRPISPADPFLSDNSRNFEAGKIYGWNACRAAMLKGQKSC